MQHFLLDLRRLRLLGSIVLALCAAALLPVAGQAGSGRDSDRDGMPNRWELSHGLNPDRADAGGDLDHDGLANIREYRQHTHPKNEDSDSDGADDGDEVRAFHSNPVDRDSDNDGIHDGDENADRDRLANEDEDDALETCVADDDDSDRDGLANEDENDFGTKVRDADSDDDGIKDGNEDADEDGFDDEDEDDSARDKCDGDRDEDGTDDEDENDVFGKIVSYNAASGLLTIKSLAGREISATVTASTHLEWNDECGGRDEAATTDLTPGMEVGDLDVDEDDATFEEVELICPLPADDN